MIQRGNQAPHAQADDQPAQDYRSRCRRVGQITVDAKDSEPIVAPTIKAVSSYLPILFESAITLLLSRSLSGSATTALSSRSCSGSVIAALSLYYCSMAFDITPHENDLLLLLLLLLLLSVYRLWRRISNAFSSAIDRLCCHF